MDLHVTARAAELWPRASTVSLQKSRWSWSSYLGEEDSVSEAEEQRPGSGQKRGGVRAGEAAGCCGTPPRATPLCWRPGDESTPPLTPAPQTCTHSLRMDSQSDTTRRNRRRKMEVLALAPADSPWPGAGPAGTASHHTPSENETITPV